MQEFSDMLLEMMKDLNELQVDLIDISANLDKKEVEKTKETKETKEKECGSKRIVSKRSIEPMTRLRATPEEIKSAEEHPEEKFIEDRINDIYSKV